MSDDTHPAPAIPPEPTDARFSMRAMLIVMAIVAAVAALVGPLVRRLEPAAQVRLLAAWSIWLAVAILWIGNMARRRAQVERLAGRTLLRLPMFHERVSTASPLRRMLSVAGAMLMCLFVLFPISGIAISPPPQRVLVQQLVSFSFMAVISIFWFGRAVATVWWRNSIRFCESGILWDRQLLRWDHVLEHRWNEYDAGILVVRGIDQRGIEAIWRTPVPPADLATVQALFDAKASQPSIPPGLPMTHLSTIPLSIAVRDANFFKVVGRILVVMALMVGYIMLRSYAPVSSEFSTATMLGIFGSALASIRWQTNMKRAGAPLVRLAARRNWPALLGFGAAAAGCYYVGYEYGWMSEWLEYALGIGFGAFAMTALGNVWPSQIDLRENGVVVPGRLYWPWQQVRVGTRDRGGSGRLVLGRGWRRIAATVPPEQRATVDRVLKEKLDGESRLENCELSR